MPGTFIAGNRATAELVGNEIPIISENIKDNCKLVPIINSMTQQNTLYIPTFRNADIMFVLDDNTFQPIYLSPFSIQSGSIIAAKMFLDQTGNDTLDGPYFNISSMVVATVEFNVVINDKLGVRLTGKASGTYVYPLT